MQKIFSHFSFFSPILNSLRNSKSAWLEERFSNIVLGSLREVEETVEHIFQNQWSDAVSLFHKSQVLQ